MPAVDYPPGVLVAAFPIIGQLHGMRGAQDQAHSKQRLQRLQATAHGGLGGGHLYGGSGKGACFDDAHEGSHQFDPVYTL